MQARWLGLFALLLVSHVCAQTELRRVNFGAQDQAQVLRFSDGDANNGWIIYTIQFTDAPKGSEQVADLGIKFCSQCGEVVVQYFGNELPSSSDPTNLPPSEHDDMHRFQSNGYGTGTVLAPLNVELYHIHMHAGEKNFFGIQFEESQCTLLLSVNNRTGDTAPPPRTLHIRVAKNYGRDMCLPCRDSPQALLSVAPLRRKETITMLK
jgi:hypothetical protein